MSFNLPSTVSVKGEFMQYTYNKYILTRSSATMSSLRSTSRSKTDQDLSSLSHRRPSWTPSLSEYEGIRLVKSYSRRRTRNEDARSQEWGANLPQSRGGHRSLPSLDEAVRGARRPRVADIEGTLEQSKILLDGPALPESPEEGKRFRSWEINVKDLVGDAVGNVCHSIFLNLCL